MPRAPDEDEQYHANSRPDTFCARREDRSARSMENRGVTAVTAAVILLLCSCLARAGHCVDAASVSSSPEGQEQEIQRLRSKVASLEDEIRGRKDETSQLESVVREKTAQIAALVGGLEVMQVTNVVDDESVMKASTNHALLEKQIQRLGNDLEDQVKKGEALEARATKAEKSLLELGRELERVEEINVEQRQRIEELGHNIHHAKKKLSEVEREARLKAQELAKVHGMWPPYWFSSRSVHCQELASAKWHLHGKPVLDALMQKVAETLAHAERLLEPHMQTTQNVQKGIIRFLEDNGLLGLLLAATLAWLMASALFVLPMFFAYKIFTAAGRRKKEVQAGRDRGRGRR